jgi:hypothetical protein
VSVRHGIPIGLHMYIMATDNYLLLLIIIIIGKDTISFMRGIYTYIPETNHYYYYYYYYYYYHYYHHHHHHLWLCSPARAMASSFTRFLDHT